MSSIFNYFRKTDEQRIEEATKTIEAVVLKRSKGEDNGAGVTNAVRSYFGSFGMFQTPREVPSPIIFIEEEDSDNETGNFSEVKDITKELTGQPAILEEVEIFPVDKHEKNDGLIVRPDKPLSKWQKTLIKGAKITGLVATVILTSPVWITAGLVIGTLYLGYKGVQLTGQGIKAGYNKLFPESTAKQKVDSEIKKAFSDAAKTINMKTEFETAQKNAKRGELELKTKEAAIKVAGSIEAEAKAIAIKTGQEAIKQGLLNKELFENLELETDETDVNYLLAGITYMGIDSVERIEEQIIAKLIVDQGHIRASNVGHTNIHYVVSEIATRRVTRSTADVDNYMNADPETLTTEKLTSFKENLLKLVPNKSKFSGYDHKVHINNMFYQFSTTGEPRKVIDAKQIQVRSLHDRVMKIKDGGDPQYKIAGELFELAEEQAEVANKAKKLTAQLEVAQQDLKAAEYIKKAFNSGVQDVESIMSKATKLSKIIEQADKELVKQDKAKTKFLRLQEVLNVLDGATDKINKVGEQLVETDKQVFNPSDQMAEHYKVYRSLAKDLASLPTQLEEVGIKTPEQLKAFIELNRKIDNGETQLHEELVNLGDGLRVVLPQLVEYVNDSSEFIKESISTADLMIHSSGVIKSHAEEIGIPQLKKQAIAKIDKLEKYFSVLKPDSSHQQYTKETFEEMRKNPLSEATFGTLKDMQAGIADLVEGLNDKLDDISIQLEIKDREIEELFNAVEAVEAKLSSLHEKGQVTDPDLALFIEGQSKSEAEALLMEAESELERNASFEDSESFKELEL